MLRFVLVGAAFAILTATLALVLALLSLLRLPGRGGISMAYSRTVCALLGVRVRTIGEPARKRPVLILANHVSWLDVLIITATAPVIFVAKREIARWPLIGWVARARGTVFVHRERRQQTREASGAIARFLARGQSVVLFAEGTSGDGNRVLPFRSALLAALAQVDRAHPTAVQSLSIGYTSVQGLPMGRQHRPLVAWYGDRKLIPHLREFLRFGAVDVILNWGPLVIEGFSDRKALVRSQEAIVRALTASALRGRPMEITSGAFGPSAGGIEPRKGAFLSAAKAAMPVGWVEPKAKPIANATSLMMGFAGAQPILRDQDFQQ